MTNLIKLLPNVNLSWSLYPAFEERVLKFNREYLIENTPAQDTTLVNILRQRWVTEPASSGYWLALRDNKPIGHVCAWLAMDWNQPYAFIYQAETLWEEGLATQWLSEMDDWIAEMNGILIARSASPITLIEFSTFNKPDVMQRYLELRGRSNVRYRSILRFNV